MFSPGQILNNRAYSAIYKWKDNCFRHGACPAYCGWCRGQVLMNNEFALSAQAIQEKIYVIRGSKVMLSHDLAKLYDVNRES